LFAQFRKQNVFKKKRKGGDMSRELRREVAGNLHRLFDLRDLFGDEFVGRQAWVCLKMLGGLGAEW